MGSILGRVIPKTQKLVLDPSLLNTQHYKGWIKGKSGAIQGKEYPLSLHLGVVATYKGAFGSPSTIVNYIYIYIYIIYSNSCCSCSFEPEIIKIGQSSYMMYSNNILNFQESTTILNACTEKVWKLIEFTMYIHIHIHIYIHKYTNIYIHSSIYNIYIYILYIYI